MWEHVQCDQPLTSISCFDGKVWAVAKNGFAYWRYGINQDNPLGELWQPVEPPSGTTFKQISIGNAGIWALDTGGRLVVRKGGCKYRK